MFEIDVDTIIDTMYHKIGPHLHSKCNFLKCNSVRQEYRISTVTKLTEINVKMLAVLITLYYRPRKIIYHTRTVHKNSTFKD